MKSMTTRLLTLTEYQTTHDITLSMEELEALRRIAPSIAVAPARSLSGAYDLTPSSDVGVIQLGSLAVDVRPKLPIERVLFLLSYALDPVRWREIPFAFEELATLLEAFIPGFVYAVRHALARGLLQGYRNTEEALTSVRGRIRVDEQLRRHYGRFPPVEVRYDEFTEDVEENRIIKAAITCLGQLRIRSAPARHALHAFDVALANVQPVTYDKRQLPHIMYTRLNQHYRPAVELAKLIVQSISMELGHGAVESVSFLVDMNAVFENFVVVTLREALKLSERSFPQGMRGRQSLYLDDARRVLLRPDLSWWEGQRCVFVGDVKYKRINSASVLHPDLYQLLAYTVATGLASGLLIYAAGEGEATTHVLSPARKRLQVTAVDLTQTPDDILRQIAAIALYVREHLAK
jgi:5-methylcytosine-specific restriction enzyme subunit McrC